MADTIQMDQALVPAVGALRPTMANAMDRRREHHIDQGDATRQPDGRVFYRRNLLGTLREREVAGAEMAAARTCRSALRATARGSAAN